MPPATFITTASNIESIHDTDHYLDEECKICEEKQKHQDKHTTADLQFNKDVYETMLPKNEGTIMRRIRQWEQDMGFLTPLRWTNLITISLFHIIAVLWLGYCILQWDLPKWQSVICFFLLTYVAGFGVTGGVHRYWTHRSYKAKLPLQLILLYCYSVAGQNTIPEWVRDHRVHHKYSETSADPHDARRGFFFSHVGWLMMKKHPEVIRQGRKIDMSDIANDPLVRFHTKHFQVFRVLFCFTLPTFIPLLWNESWHYVILSQPIYRYLLSQNRTWAVNSFAHLWGNKPYDKSIMPSDNWGVSIAALGEGWHNYHHTFPWDYKAAELPYNLNVTTMILDMFAKIGWAYDMKSASPALIASTTQRRAGSKAGQKKVEL